VLAVGRLAADHVDERRGPRYSPSHPGGLSPFLHPRV